MVYAHRKPVAEIGALFDATALIVAAHSGHGARPTRHRLQAPDRAQPWRLISASGV